MYRIYIFINFKLHHQGISSNLCLLLPQRLRVKCTKKKKCCGYSAQDRTLQKLSFLIILSDLLFDKISNINKFSEDKKVLIVNSKINQLKIILNLSVVYLQYCRMQFFQKCSKLTLFCWPVNIYEKRIKSTTSI